MFNIYIHKYILTLHHIQKFTWMILALTEKFITYDHFQDKFSEQLIFRMEIPGWVPLRSYLIRIILSSEFFGWHVLPRKQFNNVDTSACRARKLPYLMHKAT